VIRWTFNRNPDTGPIDKGHHSAEYGSIVTIDDDSLALTMPCDEMLLPALGRVMWAAIRLHYGIRDLLNSIPGQPFDRAFDQTTGSAISDLERAAASLPEPACTEIQRWCRSVARPAVEMRNGVAHAITYTTRDGVQAIGGHGPARPARYLEPELNAVTAALVRADQQRPRLSPVATDRF
jgi:hypothetical protein